MKNKYPIQSKISGGEKPRGSSYTRGRPAIDSILDV